MINANQVIQSTDLICKRPAKGISPKYLDDLIGKKAIHDIPEDEIIQWAMLR